MTDFYICPTCDHEVTVGKPCQVCSKIITFKEQPTKPKKKKPIKKLTKKPWEQDEIYDGVDLPDDDFDYDDSDKPYHTQIRIAWYWWLTAFLLAALWIISMIWSPI